MDQDPLESLRSYLKGLSQKSKDISRKIGINYEESMDDENYHEHLNTFLCGLEEFFRTQHEEFDRERDEIRRQFQEELDTARRGLEQALADGNTMKQETENARRDIDTLRQQIEESRRQLEISVQEADQLRREVTVLKQEAEAARQGNVDVSQITNQLTEARNAADNANKTLGAKTAELQEAEKKLKNAHEQIKQLQNQQNNQNKQKQQNIDELNQQKNKINQLNNELKQMKQQTHKAEQLQKQNDNLKNEIDNLKKKLSDAQIPKKQIIEYKLHEFTPEEKKMLVTKYELQELENTNKHLERQIADLKKAKEKASEQSVQEINENKEDNVSQYKQQVEDLENQLRQSKHELTQKESKLQTVNRQIDEQNTKINKLREENEQKQKDINKKEAEITKLEKSNKQLQEQKQIQKVQPQKDSSIICILFIQFIVMAVVLAAGIIIGVRYPEAVSLGLNQRFQHEKFINKMYSQGGIDRTD